MGSCELVLNDLFPAQITIDYVTKPKTCSKHVYPGERVDEDLAALLWLLGSRDLEMGSQIHTSDLLMWPLDAYEEHTVK